MSGTTVTMSPLLSEASSALASTPGAVLSAWPYAFGFAGIHYLGLMLDQSMPVGSSLMAHQLWKSLAAGITDSAKFIYFHNGYTAPGSSIA